MMPTYVVDACALLAFLKEEPGADVVENLLIQAELQEITLFINIVNLLEIYYGLYRDDGPEVAEETLAHIRRLPLTRIDTISERVFYEAGKLKAAHNISLADAFAIAEANVRSAQLVTADHHEFDALVAQHVMQAYWIR